MGSDQRDRAEQRLDTMLAHSLHTTVALLLIVAVGRSWQLGRHQIASTAVAAGIGVAYAFTRRHVGALGAVVGLWALGCALSPEFAWVVFALYFLVLHALPRPRALPLVVAMAAWSAWTTQSVVGPVIGALAAVLGTVLFGQQRTDAQRHRALVAELREAQAALAAGEHERGVLAERERLAREIHDTIAQGLASIVVLARTARTAADPGPQLELIESTAREDLAEARRLVRDLGSTPGEVGLEQALRALVDDTRARAAASGTPLDVALTVDGATRPLDPDVVTALRRGVQASLANVLQHAGARRCAVGLGWFDDEVVVDVVDDGAGFDEGAVGPGSFGLRGLRARMAQVGGRVSVDSAPGEGTTIALSVPSHPAPNETTPHDPTRQEPR